ncbi:hypothetical protein [Leifsonia sp. LS-T14]|uniref:hypothetical protein n=1 Tax=unclassified Leifsonia TaxID=2663824 RepID=UPI0035A6E547
MGTEQSSKAMWQTLLTPGPVLTVLALSVTLAAIFAPGDWVLDFGRGWLGATVLVALAVLFAALPLQPLRERSHLIGRIETLAKFLWAAALLCVSSFVGALVGAQVQSDSAGLHIGQAGSLLKTVFLLAVALAGLWFGAGITLDIWRLGPDGRVGAVSRAIRFTMQPWKPPQLGSIAIKWVLVLTSPAWLTVALVIGTVWVTQTALALAGVHVG